MLIATWMRQKPQGLAQQSQEVSITSIFLPLPKLQDSFPQSDIHIFLLCLKGNSVVEFDFSVNLMVAMWE